MYKSKDIKLTKEKLNKKFKINQSVEPKKKTSKENTYTNMTELKKEAQYWKNKTDNTCLLFFKPKLLTEESLALL